MNPSEALSWAFRIFTSDIQVIALPIVVGIVAIMVVSWGASTGLGLLLGLLSIAAGESGLSDLMRSLASGMGSLLGVVATAYIYAGLYPFLLNVARGRPVELMDVFRGRPHFSRMLGVVFLTSFATGVGSMFCLVPGVIIGLGWMLSVPLVVDRELGPVDAVKESWQLTLGHKMNLLVLALFLAGVVLVGFVACILPAILVAWPIGLLAQTYAYLKLTGEQPIEVAGR